MIRHLFVMWLLCLAGVAHAQTFPPLSGRVVDAANILPPETEAALTAKLATLETETTRQLVVATLPSLEGYDIAEYGYKLGDNWGIGQKGEKNGIILIVAPNEKKVRIEVGSGLGDVVPDVLASRIIRNQIVPRFKEGDFPGGVVAGTDAIIELIRLPAGEAAAQARQATRQPQSNGGPDIGTIIFFLMIFFFFVLPLLKAIFGRKRGRRFGGGMPVVIWGPGDWGGGGSGWSSGGGGFGDSFSGGGGSFDGGGASGDW